MRSLRSDPLKLSSVDWQHARIGTGLISRVPVGASFVLLTKRCSMLYHHRRDRSPEVVFVVKGRLIRLLFPLDRLPPTASPPHPSTPAAASPTRPPPARHTAPPCSPPSAFAPLSIDSTATRRAPVACAPARDGNAGWIRAGGRRGYLRRRS